MILKSSVKLHRLHSVLLLLTPNAPFKFSENDILQAFYDHYTKNEKNLCAHLALHLFFLSLSGCISRDLGISILLTDTLGKILCPLSSPV